MSSRNAVLEALLLVLKQQHTAESAMADSAAFRALEVQDRAFAAHLLIQLLRHRGALDALLAQYLDKPLKESRLDIQCCLLIGAAQILLMEVPDHAAVDTSVNLAKSCFKPLSGLVNAVLKRVIREGKLQWDAQTPQQRAERNTPTWLYQRWQQHYGKAVATKFAEAHLQQPALDLSFKTPELATEWAARLGAAEVMPATLRLHGYAGSITAMEGFAEGLWWVQDVAATLPVRLFGEVKGLRVLDLCAAPGGKTAQLAAAGAVVTAVDQSGIRLERLRENLARLQLDAEVIEADILQWQPEGQFDAILLDAPCSATGTIRRHPELMWQRQPEDITRLTGLQRRMIARAASWLKPGGKLVYATCSLQPEEGEAQAEAFLAKHADFSVDQEAAKRALIPQEWVTASGAVRTLPHYQAEHGGVDGFFAVALAKRA